MRRFIYIGLLIALILLLWLWLFPPQPWLNLSKKVEITPEVGASLTLKYDCRNCHRIGGSGALVGPELNGILDRSDPMLVRLWLHNPRAVKGNTPMPNFHLSDSEIEAIIAYLETLSS